MARSPNETPDIDTLIDTLLTEFERMSTFIKGASGHLSNIKASRAAGQVVESGGVDGAVIEWDAREGVSTSGSDVTAWVDRVDSQSPTVTGTPTLSTSPSGEDAISIGAGEYFTLTGIGDLPTGSNPRTIVFAGKSTTLGETLGGWGGFSYGDGTANEAFGVVIDGQNHTADLDVYQDDIVGQVVDDGVPFIAIATWDGTTGNIYHGKFLRATDTNITVDTGTTQVNIMRSFSGQTRQGDIYYASGYDFAFTPAQVEQQVTYLRDIFFNESAPVISDESLVAGGATAVTYSATVDKVCRFSCVVTASSTKPTSAQIHAGEDHTGATALASSSTTFGTDINFFAGGLEADTTYYVHFAAEDLFGLEATIVTASATTDAAATIPTAITPTSLSFPENTNVGAILGDFDADQPATSWAQGTPALSFIDLNVSTGVATLLNTVSAQSATLKVRATNGAGTYEQSVPVTITEVAVTPVTSDYQVANPAALETLLQGWAGTVPDGRDVIVLLEGGGSGTLDLSGLAFDHLVTIRGPGPYTMSVNANGEPTLSCGADFTGTLNLQGTSNIRFFRMKLTMTHGNNTGLFTGASDITFDHCALMGTPFAYNVAGTTSAGVDFILQIHNASRIAVRDCLIAYSSNCNLATYAVTDVTLARNVYAFNRHDNYKYLSACTNVTRDRNWYSRHVARRWLGDEYTHVDFSQAPNQVATVTNMRCIGEVMWAADPAVGGTGASQQGHFGKNAIFSGGYIEQCIVASVGANGVYLDQSPTNGFYVRYVDILRSEVDGPGETQGNYNPNFIGITPTYSIIGKHFGTPPTGSEYIDLGANPADDFSDYVASGLFTDYPKGYSRDFNWCRPPSSAARSHWDNANPCGAYSRKREIFVEGIHPGNQGWPVDAQWTHDFNGSGNIASNYTGSYDENGDAA